MPRRTKTVTHLGVGEPRPSTMNYWVLLDLSYLSLSNATPKSTITNVCIVTARLTLGLLYTDFHYGQIKRTGNHKRHLNDSLLSEEDEKTKITQLTWNTNLLIISSSTQGENTANKNGFPVFSCWVLATACELISLNGFNFVRDGIYSTGVGSIRGTIAQ